MSEWKDDLIDQPYAPIDLGPSVLHGVGVFVTQDIEPKGFIGQVLNAKLQRTNMIGRYINHSHTPNCYLQKRAEGGYDLHALYGVNAGDELTMDYHATDLIRRGEL